MLLRNWSILDERVNRGEGAAKALREKEKCHNHYRSKAWRGHQPFPVCFLEREREKKKPATGLWLQIREWGQLTDFE